MFNACFGEQLAGAVFPNMRDGADRGSTCRQPERPSAGRSTRSVGTVVSLVLALQTPMQSGTQVRFLPLERSSNAGNLQSQQPIKKLSRFFMIVTPLDQDAPRRMNAE
jgi:hypothetical protein